MAEQQGKRIVFIPSAPQWERLERLMDATGHSLSETMRRIVDAYFEMQETTSQPPKDD